MSKKCKYLLRFDDICPTMKWSVWNEVVDIMNEYNIKPIIAVVPDNQDKNLNCEEYDKDFWNKVRQWQNEGWTIALHGYRHLYENKKSGILKVNDYSEFVGVDYSIQKERISNGLQIFKQHGVNCNTWVAPAHSFDKNTVKCLRSCGITIISDGYSNEVFRKDNMIWVPCQLYAFSHKKSGVWTVCKHPNTWNNNDLERFREEIKKWHDEIVALDEVLNDLPKDSFIHNARQRTISYWRCSKIFVKRKLKKLMKREK